MNIKQQYIYTGDYQSAIPSDLTLYQPTKNNASFKQKHKNKINLDW